MKSLLNSSQCIRSNREEREQQQKGPFPQLPTIPGLEAIPGLLSFVLHSLPEIFPGRSAHCLHHLPKLELHHSSVKIQHEFSVTCKLQLKISPILKGYHNGTETPFPASSLNTCPDELSTLLFFLQVPRPPHPPPGSDAPHQPSHILHAHTHIHSHTHTHKHAHVHTQCSH